MSCPFCGETNTIPVFHQRLPVFLSAVPAKFFSDNKIHDITVDICPECGLGFNSNRLSGAELAPLYDNYIYIDPFKGIGGSTFHHFVDMVKKYAEPHAKIVEIGSSTGFLLRQLKDCGYGNISGIDPSPQSDTAKAKGLDIRKEYYNIDSYDQDVDLFILRHVFEHFEDPFTIFKNMLAQLKPDGKIIIETPNFDGLHHQHLFFYSPVFYRNMANAYGVKMVGCLTYANNVVAVFAKYGEDAAVKESAADIIELAKTRQAALQKNIDRLKGFLSRHKTVYWWGTGSFSVIMLSQIPQDEMCKYNIIPLDSDHDRAGYMLANAAEPVRHYSSVAGADVDAVVIGSSFAGEIKETMLKHNINAANILSF